MTRVKEPPIGTTEIPDYKSPSDRIVRSLRQAYDNLRTKVADKSQALLDVRGKLRDTQNSRDNWKTRAKTAEAKLKELEKKNISSKESLKKKI